MANDIKVMTAVDKEIVRRFNSKCVVAGTFNRQYDDTKKAYGANSGSTIQIKQIQRYVASTGATLVEQDHVERTVDLPRTTQVHVGLSFTSAEMTQELLTPEGMSKFSQEFLDASMDTIAAKVDTDILEDAQQASYNTIGTAGTLPNSYSDITAARSLLNKNLAPLENRCYIGTPDIIGSLNSGMATLFNPASEKSSDYRTGHIAKVNRFDFFESDFLAAHTNGDATGTPLINGTTTEGASQLVTDGWGNAQTLTKGSRFVVAGVRRANLVSKQAKKDLQVFVATADAVSDGSGNMTILVSPSLEAAGAYQNIGALPANDAAITVLGDPSTTYEQALFFHRDAHVFATQDLKKINSNIERYIRGKDLTMKLTMDADIRTYESISRLDILYGYAPLAPWWSGIQWGAADA
jgi:hypothetical protein